MQPFRIHTPEPILEGLAQRLARVRWPSSFDSVGSWDAGTESSYLHELVGYWSEVFDWRKAEAHLNALPQFTAQIDDVTIHFVHVRGKGPNPLPILLTHGWPSSFVEMQSLVPFLTEPESFGGCADDAFDVVVPSLPGFAYSSRSNVPVTSVYTADLWARLMSALGYRRFAAHGGDIGAGVTTRLGFAFPDRVVGIHVTAVRDPYLPADARLSEREKDFLAERARWAENEGAYSHMQRTKPQTLAYALEDSAVGLAAWMVEKFRSWSDCGGDLETRFSKDWLLTTITLYWLTNTAHSSIRYYYDSTRRPWTLGKDERICVPCAIAIFPKDLVHPPREWAERFYDVQQWTEMPRGGHFAAHEEPELLAADLRRFFRSRR